MAQQIALFGGSFNPFTLSHLAVIKAATKKFDQVIVIPCGIRPENDKPVTNDILSVHRAAMIDLSLRYLEEKNVLVEFFDLENKSFTPNFILQQLFGYLGDLWHVVGVDLLTGGAQEQSKIHSWFEGPAIWKHLNFAVCPREGYGFKPEDLPPHFQWLHPEMSMSYSSTAVRDLAKAHEPVRDLVVPEVADYIRRYDLYTGRPSSRRTVVQLKELRLNVFANPHNEEAQKVAGLLSPYVVKENPNLLVSLAGDGTLLHVANQHHRARFPIIGINFGHRGHNLSRAVVEDFPARLFEPLEVWQCPLLFVEMEKPDGSIVTDFAFNDAWVVNDSRSGKGVWMNLAVNGKVKIPKLVGDGLLVATPQGSTAYAHAMGASPLRIDDNSLRVVGNNIFEPTWKHSLESFDSELLVQHLLMGRVRGQEMYGLVDGRSHGQVISMKVRGSHFAAVELAFLPGHNFAEAIDRSQYPAQ